jgi:amidase
MTSFAAAFGMLPLAYGASAGTFAVPMHLDAPHVWTAIILEGATEMMIKGNGMGHGWEGTYTTSLLDAYARGIKHYDIGASLAIKL